ncbi:MAG: phosphocholine cytidylyltransferase family protein [Chloroflexi bacterium]|nr:phosphocholine cytidylyltransferase family protein [Chloroflexota bacterium]
MKAIVIGAGRGRRLMPLTEQQPKCFAPIAGRRILDWILEALAGGGFAPSDVAFVGGYKLPAIQDGYPQFTYFENANWAQNNILASLFCAEPAMEDGFVCTYADIVYRPHAVERLMRSAADITLVVDTDFRTRYRRRSQHPETDAEKVRAAGDRILEVSRRIPAEVAAGEYIGVAKFTPRGAAILREHYHRVRREYGDGLFQAAPSVQMAYLIHLFQEMLERGVEIHRVDTHGDYFEIDTTEDYRIALEEWR